MSQRVDRRGTNFKCIPSQTQSDACVTPNSLQTKPLPTRRKRLNRILLLPLLPSLIFIGFLGWLLFTTEPKQDKRKPLNTVTEVNDLDIISVWGGKQ